MGVVAHPPAQLRSVECPPTANVFGFKKGALERWGESMAVEVAPFGIGVTVLVAGTYGRRHQIRNGLRRPHRSRRARAPRSTQTAQWRNGSALTQRGARSPDIFAAGLAEALGGLSRSFVRPPRREPAHRRMLLIANKLLPAAAMHDLFRT